MSSILPRLRPSTVASTVLVGGTVAFLYSQYLHQKNNPVRADSGGIAYTTAPAKKILTGGPAFVSLSLESAEMVSGDTKRLRFKLPNETDVSGMPLTSAVLTLSWPKGSWTPVPRPYTPITPSDEPGHIDLLVKHYPQGKASTHIHSLTPGQSLLFALTIPGPRWSPPSPKDAQGSSKHVTLIAGGAGITPIFQLAQGILRNPDDKSTSLTLVYGANSDRDVLLKKEFDSFEKEFPGRFKAVYTVSSRQNEAAAAETSFRTGRVTKELLKEVAPPAGKSAHVYLCGPPAMETALIGNSKWGAPGGILGELGYRRDQVHKF